MSNEKPPCDDAADQHVQELLARGRRDYLAFELIDQAPDDAENLERIRESLVAVVETSVREELKQGEAIRGAAAELLRRPRASDLFAAWRSCLEAAAPDRKAMKRLCAEFPALVDALGQDALFGESDFIRETLKHYGRRGLDMLRGGLGEGLRSLPEDRRKALIEWLTPYAGSAYDKPFAGLAVVAAVLIQDGGDELLKRLSEAVPPEAFEEQVPPDKFAIRCGEGLERVPRALQPRFARLAALAAIQSCGSAAAIGAKLPPRLERLSPDARAEYLDAFIRLVDEVGIRTVGFCLNKLHDLYAGRASAAGAYVEQVCLVARRYGPSAAAAFLEQRTAASRRAWPA